MLFSMFLFSRSQKRQLTDHCYVEWTNGFHVHCFTRKIRGFTVDVGQLKVSLNWSIPLQPMVLRVNQCTARLLVQSSGIPWTSIQNPFVKPLLMATTSLFNFCTSPIHQWSRSLLMLLVRWHLRSKRVSLHVASPKDGSTKAQRINFIRRHQILWNLRPKDPCVEVAPESSASLICSHCSPDPRRFCCDENHNEVFGWNFIRQLQS